MSFLSPKDSFNMSLLKHLVQIRSSNVDKIIDENEFPVRLCNYVDVYYNERITNKIEFSAGSATTQEIKRFSLKENDVLITKDSETPADIAIPAIVERSGTDSVCGYHLAILRPNPERITGKFLF